MILKDGEKLRCPKCGGSRFYATAHVTQDWELDAKGFFVDSVNNCVEVTVEVVPFTTARNMESIVLGIIV